MIAFLFYSQFVQCPNFFGIGIVDSCLYSRGRAQTNHMKNMTQEKKESF